MVAGIFAFSQAGLRVFFGLFWIGPAVFSDCVVGRYVLNLHSQVVQLVARDSGVPDGQHTCCHLAASRAKNPLARPHSGSEGAGHPNKDWAIRR